MLVQDFLRQTNHNVHPLKALEKLYGIGSKVHPKYPNLVQLRYSQIDSPRDNPIVCECRGLILDMFRDWQVVAWPFHRFFNADEASAAKIDWQTARVQEKADGSLIVMYHYGGKWQVATSGTPDASGQVNGLSMTFADLFWKTFEAQFGGPIESDPTADAGIQCIDLPGGGVQCVTPTLPYCRLLPNNITFLWELTSPYNRIVVQHQQPRVILLAMRSRTTGEEFDPRDYQKDGWIPNNWPIVKHFDLTSLDQVVEAAAELDPMQQEGFVVVDAAFNRVKVKSLNYVAIHHMKGEGGLTAKKVLGRIAAGETQEILAHFPEWTPVFTEVKDRLEVLVEELEANWANINRRLAGYQSPQPNLRKEFAGYAVKSRVPAALFSLLDKKVTTAREYLTKMPIDSLAAVLELDKIRIDPKVICATVES